MLSDEQLEEYFLIINNSDSDRFKRRESAKNIEKYINELKEQKDGAYKERNLLVAALSKIFPAHIALHPEEDESWEEDWKNIVFIEIPIGKEKIAQVSWHIHDSEIGYFKHLQEGKNEWDGHDTKEKYNRLRRMKPNEFK